MRTNKVVINPGENVWRFIRTARDGASADEIRNMTGAAMFHALGPANYTEEPWELIETSFDPRRWRVGAARPIEVVDVVQSTTPPELPQGTELGNRHWHTETIPAVSTQGGVPPWFVVARFWWRQYPVTIPLPGWRVNFLGIRKNTLVGADWVLDRAVQPFPAHQAPDPGAATWGETQKRSATKTLRKVSSYGGAVLLLVGFAGIGMWAFSKAGNGNGSKG